MTGQTYEETLAAPSYPTSTQQLAGDRDPESGPQASQWSTIDHPEEVERRSDDPENWIVRKWIELADVALRPDDDEGGAA